MVSGPGVFVLWSNGVIQCGFRFGRNECGVSRAFSFNYKFSATCVYIFSVSLLMQIGFFFLFFLESCFELWFSEPG